MRFCSMPFISMPLLPSAPTRRIGRTTPGGTGAIGERPSHECWRKAVGCRKSPTNMRWYSIKVRVSKTHPANRVSHLGSEWTGG